MSDLAPQSFADAAAEVVGELRSEMASVSRSMAALMADPQARAAERRPATMGRRPATVTVVNLGPPLTADVELNGVLVPGASPQSTYRPQVGDIVWLEFLGSDPHISPPLTTEDNRRWNNFTLGSGWTVAASPALVPGYWRDPLGIVHLRGSCGGGADASAVATLPTGFRPPGDAAFPVVAGTGLAFSNGIVGIAAASGTITYYGPAAPGIVSLDVVTFRID